MDTAGMHRIRDWMGWLLVPLVVVMGLVDLRRGLDGRPAMVSAYLVGFVLLVLVSLPSSWRMVRRSSRETRGMAAGFALLMGWALVTASTGALPVVQRIQVTRGVLVTPVLTALVTMLAAFCLAPLVSRLQLWVASWAVLFCSVVNWPRAVRVHGSLRIATGMGGAAVYHVVLLACAALFLGCVLSGWRRRASAVGALLSVALLVGVGSRAGVGCLLLFGLLVGAWALQQGLGRWVGRVAGVGAVALVALVTLVPSLRRLLLLSEPRRQQNFTLAMELWSDSPHNMVLGLGSGQLWPWYALDIRMIPAPGSMMIKTAYGMVLNSPHSTLLAVLVELGLLGFLVLVGTLALLVLRMVRLWKGQDRVALVVSMALVASLGAFFFDTYLLKNFGVSFWWWLMLFAPVAGQPTRT